MEGTVLVGLLEDGLLSAWGRPGRLAVLLEGFPEVTTRRGLGRAGRVHAEPVAAWSGCQEVTEIVSVRPAPFIDQHLTGLGTRGDLDDLLPLLQVGLGWRVGAGLDGDADWAGVGAGMHHRVLLEGLTSARRPVKTSSGTSATTP